MSKKHILGKGLQSLLRDEVQTIEQNQVMNSNVIKIKITDIVPGPYQPRKKFAYDKIQELAASIGSSGLIQPIIVNKTSKNQYQIISGERRWRAAQIAGLNEIDVIIKNIPNDEILRIALIENIQREELTCIEEAEGFLMLIKEFHYSQEDLATLLGKSRSHIANLLRLNSLDDIIKEMVNNNSLSMGHARCLVHHDDAIDIAQHIIENNLNVRETEELVKNWPIEFTEPPIEKKNIPNNVTKLTKDATKINPTPPAVIDSELHLLEDNLSETFNLKVSIEEDREGGGRLIFHYNDMNQLDAILAKIQNI